LAPICCARAPFRRGGAGRSRPRRGVVTGTPPAAKMSNLQLPVVPASVLARGPLAITWAGGLASPTLPPAGGAAGLSEWCPVSRRPGSVRHELIAAVLLAAVLLGAIAGYSAASLLILLTVSILACLMGNAIAGQGWWIPLGLTYAGLSGLSLAFLRGDDHSGL